MEDLADDKWWLDAGLVNVRQIRRMQDVEFISELFIALVGGPQDKKNTLEEYYANFEASMSDWTDWVAVFERVRDFISTLLPAEELRPWRGRSDFYTLFLALAPLAERASKLTNMERDTVRAELRLFRAAVDQAKRKDNQRRFAEDIHVYAEAVTRAASDLGRRRGHECRNGAGPGPFEQRRGGPEFGRGELQHGLRFPGACADRQPRSAPP